MEMTVIKKKLDANQSIIDHFKDFTGFFLKSFQDSFKVYEKHVEILTDW